MDGWQEGRQISLALEASLVYFVTSAFSLTCVTHTHQFVVLGMAVALERLKKEQIAAAEAITTETAPEVPQTSRTPSVSPAQPKRTGAPARSPKYRFNRPVARSLND